MIGANAEPFCSRFTRCVTGVLGLKKVTQFVLIWVTAADVLPPDDGDAVWWARLWWARLWWARRTCWRSRPAWRCHRCCTP